MFESDRRTRFFVSTSLAMLKSRSTEALEGTDVLYFRNSWCNPSKFFISESGYSTGTSRYRDNSSCASAGSVWCPNEKKSSGMDEVAKSALDGLVTTASSVLMSLVALSRIELSGIHDSLNLGSRQLATTSSLFPLRCPNLQSPTIH